MRFRFLSMRMKINRMKGEGIGMSKTDMIILKRQQLYDEIWKISAAGVAKKYNLNYGKLLISLKEANIPYPPSGYWTRLNCGKDVSNDVIALPDSDIEDVNLYPEGFSFRKKKKKNNAKEMQENVESDTESELATEASAERLAEVSKQQENEVKSDPLDEESVPDTILSFLPKEERSEVIGVLKTIEIKKNARFHSKVISYKQSVKEWKKQERERHSYPYGGRRNYGQNANDVPPFINDISSEGLERVYRILDALFKAVEQLGGEVYDNLVMRIREDSVHIKFAEGQDKIPHALSRQEARLLVEYNDAKKQGRYASRPQIKKYDYVYNGKLRIIFSDGKYIRDSSQVNIEEKLDEILIRLYENSEENRIAREKREEAHRQYLEEQRRKEEIQQRYEKEVDNTVALVNQAKDYEIACQIRNYIFALCKEGELTEEKSKWIEWARKKADWYDPTVAREDEYLGKRKYSLAEEEKELAKNRRSGWKL